MTTLDYLSWGDAPTRMMQQHTTAERYNLTPPKRPGRHRPAPGRTPARHYINRHTTT